MATTKFSHITSFFISIIATVVFCLAIASNISPLLRGPAPYPPEWQWVYQFTNTLSKVWAPSIVSIIFVGGFFFFDREKIQKKDFFSAYFLLFIIFIMLLLQASVLFFSRAGVGVLLERILNPGINGYFTTAISVANVNEFLKTYQQHVAHFPMRAADHPPFAVLFFSLLLFVSSKLSFLFPLVEKISMHHVDIENIWSHLLPFQKLAAIMGSIFIPLLSCCVAIPLYLFTKLYYGKKIAVRACFLYAVFPSVSLFLPLNDVFLAVFPLFGFVLFLLAERKQNYFFYFFSGLLCCIGVFFSVSLLVPILMLSFLLCMQKKTYKKKITASLATLFGIFIIPFVLFIFWKFNTLRIFLEITSLQAKRSYLPWLFYNTYDFFIFSGIPVLIYSALIVNGILKDFSKRKLYRDILAVSFFAVFLLLDISGFSRAETGRIWMPYMPFLAGIVAAFITNEKKFDTTFFSTMLCLQIVQLLVMQEFWVTLW